MDGAVLAGGDSRRMGADKASLLWDGEPLWRRQERVLRDGGATDVFVVRKPGQPALAGAALRCDLWEQAGPVAGVHAALAAASGPLVAVLAVDMPAIDGAWFLWLRGFCRPGAGAIARHADAFEPLAAIYPREAMAEILRCLARRDRSLQRLARELAAAGRMTVLPLAAEDVWRVRSVNTPDSLSSWNPIAALRAAGVVSDPSARAAPLAGGVSSDIFIVDDGPRRLVVKRALRKLRVADDWFAHPGRNRTERDFLAYAGAIVPEAVPRILYADPSADWFAMEFLGEPLRNWKEELLAGRADPGIASLAGATLGRLHAASWGDPQARQAFATLDNFTALRLEPYLRSAAGRVPAVGAILRAEAERLAGSQVALVHGDYSPKNLMVSPASSSGPARLVVLDAEAAWYGDPAFDAAFLLTHLHLKALLHSGRPEPLLALIPAAWAAYAGALGGRFDSALESRTARLTLALLLARVHGKSPAEYLDEGARRIVSDFACRHLPRPPDTMAALTAAWRRALPSPRTP